MMSFGKEELKILKNLNTPSKIQDFLNDLQINFEENGETCMSPRKVLREKKAHCAEAAILAAAALKIQGFKPLILDLEANDKDFDHVIAIFKKKGYWGAVGKTNHSVLRYREPVYKTIRELVMSFFHEYFTNRDGSKTLRRYSAPLNLEKFRKKGWMTSEKDLWFILEHLADSKHFDILNRSQIAGLRKADRIEIEAGKLVEEKEPEVQSTL